MDVQCHLGAGMPKPFIKTRRSSLAKENLTGHRMLGPDLELRPLTRLRAGRISKKPARVFWRSAKLHDEMKVTETIQIESIPTSIARIGLSTWAIGGREWGGTEEKDAIETIQYAVDQGINLIDTAPAYGF